MIPAPPVSVTLVLPLAYGGLGVEMAPDYHTLYVLHQPINDSHNYAL